MKSSRVLIAGALGASLVGCSAAQVKPDAPVVAAKSKPVQASAAQKRSAPVATPELARAVPAKAQPEVDPFQAGLVAFDAGKLDQAAEDFRAALKKDPKNVRAQHDLGVVAWRQGDLDGAQKAFEAATGMDPSFAPSLVQRARLLRVRNQADAGIALLEKATAGGPLQHDPKVLNELATAYRLEKNFAKAESVCRGVLARSKDDVEALKALSRIYFDQGNLRLAAFVAAKVAKIAPQDASAHNDLGVIALQLGQTPVALAEFQKAVELDPKFEPGFLNLGAIALRYRDYQGAEKALSQATAIAPRDAKAQLAYAWALDGERMQDASKAGVAGAAYEKAFALAPDSADAVCGAAWAYAADASGMAKAKTFLERCKALASTSAEDKQRIDERLRAIAARQAAPVTKPGVGANGIAQTAKPGAGGNGVAQPANPGAGGNGTAQTAEAQKPSVTANAPTADAKPATDEPVFPTQAAEHANSATGGSAAEGTTGASTAPDSATKISGAASNVAAPTVPDTATGGSGAAGTTAAPAVSDSASGHSGSTGTVMAPTDAAVQAPAAIERTSVQATDGQKTAPATTEQLAPSQGVPQAGAGPDSALHESDTPGSAGASAGSGAN